MNSLLLVGLLLCPLHAGVREGNHSTGGCKYFGNCFGGLRHLSVDWAAFKVGEVVNVAMRATCQIGKSVSVEPVHDIISRLLPISHSESHVNIREGRVTPILIILVHGPIVQHHEAPKQSDLRSEKA